MQCGSPLATLGQGSWEGINRVSPAQDAQPSSFPANTLASRVVPSPLPSLSDLQLKPPVPFPPLTPRANAWPKLPSSLSPHHGGQGLASSQRQHRLEALRAHTPLWSSDIIGNLHQPHLLLVALTMQFTGQLALLYMGAHKDGSRHRHGVLAEGPTTRALTSYP